MIAARIGRGLGFGFFLGTVRRSAVVRTVIADGVERIVQTADKNGQTFPVCRSGDGYSDASVLAEDRLALCLLDRELEVCRHAGSTQPGFEIVLRSFDIGAHVIHTRFGRHCIQPVVCAVFQNEVRILCVHLSDAADRYAGRFIGCFAVGPVFDRDRPVQNRRPLLDLPDNVASFRAAGLIVPDIVRIDDRDDARIGADIRCRYGKASVLARRKLQARDPGDGTDVVYDLVGLRFAVITCRTLLERRDIDCARRDRKFGRCGCPAVVFRAQNADRNFVRTGVDGHIGRIISSAVRGLEPIDVLPFRRHAERDEQTAFRRVLRVSDDLIAVKICRVEICPAVYPFAERAVDRDRHAVSLCVDREDKYKRDVFRIAPSVVIGIRKRDRNAVFGGRRCGDGGISRNRIGAIGTAARHDAGEDFRTENIHPGFRTHICKDRRLRLSREEQGVVFNGLAVYGPGKIDRIFVDIERAVECLIVPVVVLAVLGMARDEEFDIVPAGAVFTRGDGLHERFVGLIGAFVQRGVENAFALRFAVAQIDPLQAGFAEPDLLRGAFAAACCAVFQSRPAEISQFVGGCSDFHLEGELRADIAFRVARSSNDVEVICAALGDVHDLELIGRNAVFGVAGRLGHIEGDGKSVLRCSGLLGELIGSERLMLISVIDRRLADAVTAVSDVLFPERGGIHRIDPGIGGTFAVIGVAAESDGIVVIQRRAEYDIAAHDRCGIDSALHFKADNGIVKQQCFPVGACIGVRGGKARPLGKLRRERRHLCAVFGTDVTDRDDDLAAGNGERSVCSVFAACEGDDIVLEKFCICRCLGDKVVGPDGRLLGDKAAVRGDHRRDNDADIIDKFMASAGVVPPFSLRILRRGCGIAVSHAVVRHLDEDLTLVDDELFGIVA